MEQKIRKHQIALYINQSETEVEDWLRICKSTNLTISMNPATEDVYYICDENPTTELNNYSPAIEQDITTIKGSPDYDFFFKKYFERATGENAKADFLIIYIAETEDGTTYKASKTDATIIVNDLNANDSKLNINLAFGGKSENGTATISEDGIPTFTKE